MTGMASPAASSYFIPTGADTYEPTIHVQGAWRSTEQHVSPLVGLLTHALEQHDPSPDLQLCRIGVDILGMIPLASTTVRVETIRPGRTIELLQATATVRGRDVVTARGWRLARHDTAAVAGAEIPALPTPDTWPIWDGATSWEGGYIAAAQFRADPERRLGRGRMWLRTPYPLIEGVVTGPVASFTMLVDTANGVAMRADPRDWAFPNVDLTIDMWRQPQPGWVGFDTTVAIGTTGLGLTSSWLHDVLGPCGRAEQMLTVRPLDSLT